MQTLSFSNASALLGFLLLSLLTLIFFSILKLLLQEGGSLTAEGTDLAAFISCPCLDENVWHHSSDVKLSYRRIELTIDLNAFNLHDGFYLADP